MFDIDKWAEIYITIRKNMLRTFLTAFSVAWGIFMLIILLGAGKGLQNGFANNFNDDAVNSIWVSSGQTSIPYEGLQSGKYIHFTNDDYDALNGSIEEADHMTSRFNRYNQVATYKSESSTFSIRAVHPDHKYLEKSLVTQGRFINDIDVSQARKVAAIGELVKEALFKDEDPMGKFISISGVSFKVIGVYKDEGQEGEMNYIYLPVSAAQQAYNGQNRVNQIMFTVGDANEEESAAIVEEVRQQMASRHNFSPADQRAIYIRSTIENYMNIMNVLLMIEIFIWIIGVMTIIAGVVGVSNIMLILVKERTKEIGIRKALGATPFSIISLIVMEAIVITSVAGYFGLVAGILLIESLSSLFTEGWFQNPEVNMTTALVALLVLVVAGAAAGFFPARKAAAIQPIVALRDE